MHFLHCICVDIYLKVNARACVHLTDSGRVCVSKLWRRCRGVLKEGEGEEWGLSKAWRGGGGGREGGRTRGAGWVEPSHTRKHTHTIAPVREKTRLRSLPPCLLHLSPLIIDLPNHKAVLNHFNYNATTTDHIFRVYENHEIVAHNRWSISNHFENLSVLRWCVIPFGESRSLTVTRASRGAGYKKPLNT